MDLYFINSEEEQVAVVRGAIAEPVIENQTIKGRPFAVNVPLANRTTDMVIPVPALAGGGAEVYASAVPIIGGLSVKHGTTPTFAETSSGVKNTLIEATDVEVIIPGVKRQDDMVVPFWKVQITGGAAPEYMKISAWDFPSFSNAAPSWWVDPGA